MNQSWTKSYYFAPENGSTLAAGDFCIMSRFPVEGTHFEWLEGNQRRGVLLARLRVGKNQLTVATVHLESFPESGLVRIRQLERVFSLLALDNEAILAGDFNFGDGEDEESSLPQEYCDLWKSLRLGEAGFTWDIEKSEWARRDSFPDEPSRRIDRIFIKSKWWKPAEIDIIGTERIKPMLFPSDHFGLKAALKRKGL
jgi:endonuclease/exonuclease/phosphatase family metal-dependent hydrolase